MGLTSSAQGADLVYIHTIIFYLEPGLINMVLVLYDVVPLKSSTKEFKDANTWCWPISDIISSKATLDCYDLKAFSNYPADSSFAVLLAV